MGFLARLVMFGAIVAAVGVVGKLVNGTLFEKDRRVVRIDRSSSRSLRASERRARAERPARPEVPEVAEVPDAAEIEAIVASAEAVAMSAASSASAAAGVSVWSDRDARESAKAKASEEIRIVSKNGATFLSVRRDHIVAGLSDSLRQHIAAEMDEKRSQKEGSSKLGDMIASTVMESVQKLVGKEVAVPIDALESAGLDGNRIVLEYRDGKPDGFMALENIKFDDKNEFLEQFSERDAKRFVTVVKSHIKQKTK